MRAIFMTGLGALLALAIGGASGPLALAQDVALAQNTAAGGFDRVDANSDGEINEAEWDQFSSHLFDRVDKDGDGHGSPEELGQGFESFDYNEDGVIHGHEAPLVIILGDKDGDGRVTKDEFESIDWSRSSIDTNGDGAVSRDEFGQAHRSIYDRADFDRSTTLGRSEYDAAPSFTLFRF